MDRPAAMPVALLQFTLSPEEKSDAETAAFVELYWDALEAEKKIARKTKAVARHAKRSAGWAAATVVNMASRWARHIDLARTTFVDMRQAEIVGCTDLRMFLHMWRRTVQPKQHGALKAPKDGKCHFMRVSYALQVGIVLPMLSHRDLVSMSSVSSKLRVVAEDGCIWSLQMARRFPFSSLSPACIKDWKYAFLCEVNQAVASLECFHTKTNLLDETRPILGVPIEFTVNPKTGKTDYIYSTMEFLSVDAFVQDGVRKTVYKEDFSHLLPMYLSEAHWKRALPFLKHVLPQLLPHRPTSFRPEMALEVFSKMINTLVVLVCDKGIAFSDRMAKSYCLLHRWALRCIEEWPELQQFIDGHVDSFCRGQQHRCKHVEPSLGEFMALMLLSSKPWGRVIPHLLEEFNDRQVLWLCQECPGLANMSGCAAPSDDERTKQSWEAQLVGKRLFSFHASCHALFWEARTRIDVIRDYDRFYGQPSHDTVSRLTRQTASVLSMNSWAEFFNAVHVKLPSNEKLAEMLRASVRNSRRRGYHRDGMDFNLVHASGTSKILRKGESYLAAATLKAVDLEEHWSWSDGDTKYLDATCLLYDRGHSFIGLLDYSNTTITKIGQRSIKEGVLSHSGDQLDAEKHSGMHTIHVQLDALPDDVQYLYVTVSSWAGAKLKDIRQPSVRLCQANGEELCSYNVDGADGSKTAILMCVLHRRPERSTAKTSRWALEAIGDVGFGAAGGYQPIKDMIDGFKQRKGWNN